MQLHRRHFFLPKLISTYQLIVHVFIVLFNDDV